MVYKHVIMQFEDILDIIPETPEEDTSLSQQLQSQEEAGKHRLHAFLELKTPIVKVEVTPSTSNNKPTLLLLWTLKKR